MPVACGESVLTGQNGSIAFKPAGTSVCLKDYSDFPANTTAVITVPENGFLVNDVVQFTAEDGGNLDSGLTAATDYTIVSKTTSAPLTVTVQLTSALGTDVVLQGDGGTGSADSPAPAHINMALSEFTSVCHVSSFEVSLDRDNVETTSLSCVCETGSTSNLAPFKTYQPGFVEATGSMEVQFTEDQSSMASRLIKSALSKDQNGAEVRLYISAVCTSGSIDETASQYIQAPISILGFSFSVTPSEVTTASVSFAFTGQPSVVQL